MCPSPIYSSHPNNRLVKRRRVPTAAEQCGCTILRELARRAANGSHSVAPNARNSVLRSSNMKTAQRAERRRGWRVGTAATLPVCQFRETLRTEPSYFAAAAHPIINIGFVR